MLKNFIDFNLRNFLKFSRKDYSQKDFNNSENDYVSALLEIISKFDFKNRINILDIGAKNWSYIEALHRFFSSKCSDFQIDGVELDAYRLNNKGYSRIEVAKYFCKDLNNTNYIAGNFLALDKKYDVITWFLPFVFYNPHKSWGLPKKYFYPEKMLNHALNLLNDDGIILVVNQGAQEFIEQKKLYNLLGIDFIEYGEFSTENSPYKHKRFVSIIKKNTYAFISNPEAS